MAWIQTFDAVVVRLAGRQRGLITHAQFVGLGATQAMIHTRLITGRWVLMARGLYRLGGAPVTWHQRALGACLLSREGAVLSHRSAAVLWGVSGFRPGPLEITVPRGRRGMRSPRCTAASIFLEVTARLVNGSRSPSRFVCSPTSRQE